MLVIPAPATTVEIQKAAHGVIDFARDAEWDKLFAVLDCSVAGLVNVRPAVRQYGVLHQAVYNGSEESVVKLLDQYGADPTLLTQADESAAELANGQGHAEIAKLLESKVNGLTGGKEDEETCELTPEKVVKSTGDNFPVGQAKVEVTMAPEFLTIEIIGAAHKAIDLAKDGKWQDLYNVLDSQRELVNCRPAVREYGILHQAAYHNNREAVDNLIRKFGADPQMRTKSGKTSADVADMQGHGKLAALISSFDEPLAGADDDDVQMAQMPDGTWKVTTKDSAPASTEMSAASPASPAVDDTSAVKTPPAKKAKVEPKSVSTEKSAASPAMDDSAVVKTPPAKKAKIEPKSKSKPKAKAKAATAAKESVAKAVESTPPKKAKIEPEPKLDPQPTTNPREAKESVAKAVESLPPKKAKAEPEPTRADIAPPRSSVSDVSRSSEPVDEYFGEKANCEVVQSGDTVWSSTLNQGAGKSRRICVLQVLRNTSGGGYSFWYRHGPADAEGRNDEAKFEDLDSATAAFTAKFFAQTNNRWENRASFKTFFGKFTLPKA